MTVRHWQHVEEVHLLDYKKFLDHGIPIPTQASLPANTAVLIQAVGEKQLEGIYVQKLKAIRPLTNKTAPNRDLRLYLDSINNPDITMLAIDGLMGSGKTSTIIKHLIEENLKDVKLDRSSPDEPNHSRAERSRTFKMPPKDNGEKKLNKEGTAKRKVLIAKPYVNASGEEYGFLPGDIDQKFDPTLENFIQYFNRWHPAGYDLLKLNGYIDVMPLGFIRGMDVENMDIVADECQNTNELISLATRKANNSRIFFLGDTSPFQIDRVGNTPKKNGLRDLIDLLQGAPYFQYIEMQSLEHIVRSYETKDIVRRLFKKHGEDPKEWVI